MTKQKDKKARRIVKQNTYADPEQRLFSQIQDFHFSQGFGEKTERVKHQNERTERAIQDIFGFEVLKKNTICSSKKREPNGQKSGQPMMQPDGNLNLSAGGKWVWSAFNTANSMVRNSFMRVTNEGKIEIVAPDGSVTWASRKNINEVLEPIKVTMTNGDVIYVSPVDNNAPGGVQWGIVANITDLTDISAADAKADFKGETNTAAIVVKATNSGRVYAANVCADLVAYGYDDWYLPAAGELNEMYLKLGPKGSGQIRDGVYWSSSEFAIDIAWDQNFDDGNQINDVKFNVFRCRCVRK